MRGMACHQEMVIATLVNKSLFRCPVISQCMPFLSNRLHRHLSNGSVYWNAIMMKIMRRGYLNANGFLFSRLSPPWTDAQIDNDQCIRSSIYTYWVWRLSRWFFLWAQKICLHIQSFFYNWGVPCVWNISMWSRRGHQWCIIPYHGHWRPNDESNQRIQGNRIDLVITLYSVFTTICKFHESIPPS